MDQIVNILKEIPSVITSDTPSNVASATSPKMSNDETITLPNNRPTAEKPIVFDKTRACGIMYEKWPVLEFSDLNSSILDLFTKGTSQSVASSLLFELTRSDSDEGGGNIRLNNEEHLRWCMQILNHSLTLSFATSREYETLKGAVRIYLHWLKALCDVPDGNIPAPLLDTPERYFRNIIDALRWVFCKRDEEETSHLLASSNVQVPRSLAIDRQAVEIDMILDSLRFLTKNASRKYQDEVWARLLSFQLNASDLLLSEPGATEDMGSRICIRVADSLFEMWLTAVVQEHIPSPMYWSSLASLTRRWRHNTPIIECWAKKTLALTVLVCKKMYGDDYLKIDVADESVAQFATVPTMDDDEDGEIHLLYATWYNILCLVDSPAKILNHDANKNFSLNGNAPRRTESSVSNVDSNDSSLRVSFFLAATCLQRMVDLFYGDNRTQIALTTNESPLTNAQPAATVGALVSDSHSQRTHSTAGPDSRHASVSYQSNQHVDESVGSSTLTSVATSVAPTMSTEGRSMASSNRSQSTATSGHSTAKEASQRTHSTTEHSLGLSATTQSRASEQASATMTYKSAPLPHTGMSSIGESISHIVSVASAPPVPALSNSLASDSKSPRQSGAAVSQTVLEPPLTPHQIAQRYVTNFLLNNPVTTPHIGNKRPKSERMLALFGQWLFAIASVPTKPEGFSRRSEIVSDDVISGLSLHSVDLDDIPEAMSPVMGRSEQQHHQQQSQYHHGSTAGHSTHTYHTTSTRRRSVGSSCSSVAGESDAMSTSTISRVASASDSGYPMVDGVTAGRAAALSALIRIVCSKTSQEKIPASQLSNVYATLFQTLVEKDRIMLCTLFYYGRNLFRLGLPGIEALLPHFLFALDIVIIESSKLRLHPSITDVEVRRACLRALSSVISWPTTFGMSKIPQVPDAASLKSNAPTYLHLRWRMFKTLMFSLKNETDPINLHISLSLCTILVEESCVFDMRLNEEQTKEMIKICTMQSSTGQPEKGLCASIVRGVLSAVCDRIGRTDSIDHQTSLAVIDVFNCISRVHHTVLFNNMDVSTGTLVIATLCRFIEQQLGKPPPFHSKDLHSTVVAAYNAVAAWLTAAPLLTECVGVLNTVCDAIQLGVTGSKKPPSENPDEPKPKAASQRVLEAAEYVMYTMFGVVGRRTTAVCDERKLAQKYGLDPEKFIHVLVNGDTLISLHEASNIPKLADQSATVIYVRRSPMQAANCGVAKLKAHPDGYRPENQPPLTPLSAVSHLGNDAFSRSSQATITSALTTGSIISGVSLAPTTISAPAVMIEHKSSCDEASAKQAAAAAAQRIQANALGEQFVIPQEFYKNTCKLDTMAKTLEATAETETIVNVMHQHSKGGETFFDKAKRNNIYESMTDAERRTQPARPHDKCSSVRLMLYDFGLIDQKTFGTELVVLDSKSSDEFYTILHEMVDACPSRTNQTTHIFYVKDGQRSAVDILDNALNIQNTCADFCGFLSSLGEGIEIGVHDGWTGHWSTAYTNDPLATKESDGVDHYILDGIQNALWWTDGANVEMTFLMPTERSVRLFKQTISSPATSSRRGSNNNNNSKTASITSDESHHDGLLHPNNGSQRGEKSPSNMSDRDFRPYLGGGSSMGGGAVIGRRTCEMKVMFVWLERAEDMNNFPFSELLCTCDDGGDVGKPPGSAGLQDSPFVPAHHILFVHLIEPGIVQVRTGGTPNRFGEAGPLVDGVVVSLANLASFVRYTILNIAKRDVAEIENYQFPHTRRKQAIMDFAKRFAANLTYEEFVVNLIKS